jgi:predicted flap endonuclease-1-like 5' DNA nuclease
MRLQGKGLWAYRRWELEQALGMAPQMDITHILYKVGQGPWQGKEPYYIDDAAQLAQKIRQAGYTPIAWSFTTLGDPDFEAAMVVRAFNDGYDGFVFNAEDASSEQRPNALAVGNQLRAAGIDLTKLYLCSYPTPLTHHPDIPFNEIGPYCQGGLMPMAYGTYLLPPSIVVGQWTYAQNEQWMVQQGLQLPIHPVLGPYYDNAGQQHMTKDEFQEWLDHLAVHTPSFFSVYTAAVLEPAYFAPIRAFVLSEPPPLPQPTCEVKVVSPDVGYLNIRSGPDSSHALITQVPHDSLLGALEPEATVHEKMGQPGEWLHVLTPNGKVGYAAAWYLALPGAPPPPIPHPTCKVKVISPDVGYLSVRSGPDSSYALITQVPHDSLLDALEPEATVHEKVGQPGEWLHVLTPNEEVGYAAAWYLALPEAPPPPPPPPPAEVVYPVVESPDYGLRVRSGPGTTHPTVWWIPHQTVLTSLEAPDVTGDKLGQEGQWLNVRTPSRKEGYVAAWYLRAPEGPDNRQPVEDQSLPLGHSAWLFGMHAATIADDDPHNRHKIRKLFESQGKRGWIFFTESLGCHPQNIHLNPEIRNRLWDWATSGYGVVVRLNYGYHPSGTIPESQFYDQFAATCARWVELYLKHDEVPASTYNWIIQIGNEQNNISEHPGNDAGIKEHISPQRYASAFNKAYAAIKAVLPNTSIAPGAIDPYHSAPWALEGNKRYRPLDYFQQMLAGITELDAFVLHAYTHGPSLARITALDTFGDPFLGDHYFDFQTYRLFMERIPARWKEAPALITETNHICRQSGAPACDNASQHGWDNANIGWVRQVYAEIDAWNQTPYAQQIHGVLLYRWLGDAWELRNKGQVLEDFKQALGHDYRWRTSGSVMTAEPVPPTGVLTAEAAPSAGVLTAEAAPPADDLTRIWGIGSRTAALLQAAGVTTYAQLGAMDAGWLKELLGETGIRVGRTTTWPLQARLASAGNWETLATLQRTFRRRAR